MKSSYNLEVVARDDGQQISAPVTIHITKDAQDDASIEQFTDKLNDLPETLEYSVLENVEGKSRFWISDLLSLTNISQSHLSFSLSRSAGRQPESPAREQEEGGSQRAPDSQPRGQGGLPTQRRRAAVHLEASGPRGARLLHGDHCAGQERNNKRKAGRSGQGKTDDK